MISSIYISTHILSKNVKKGKPIHLIIHFMQLIVSKLIYRFFEFSLLSIFIVATVLD